MEIFKKSKLLSDEQLLKIITWPSGLTATQARDMIGGTTRFIDFDNTLVSYPNDRLLLFREFFCGVPTRQFLEDKPFIVHTWHLGWTPECLFVPELRDNYKLVCPSILDIKTLPRPVLICRPPRLWLKISSSEVKHSDDWGEHRLYKDLSAIGIPRGAEVYDDCAMAVYAPNCQIISEF